MTTALTADTTWLSSSLRLVVVRLIEAGSECTRSQLYQTLCSTKRWTEKERPQNIIIWLLEGLLLVLLLVLQFSLLLVLY